MAITKPEKIPKKKINSVDVTSMAGGLYLLGAQNAQPNQFVSSRNMMITPDGKATQRYALVPFLPKTDNISYQKYPALVDGEIHYFTMDGTKVKWCKRGDENWVDCDGDAINSFSDGEVHVTTFLRVSNKLLIMNGEDKLAYVDLAVPGFPVVKFTPLADPANSPTVTATGITTSGSYNLYYAISFNSTIGTTKLSPIRTQAVSKPRSAWNPNGTSEFLTIARNNTAPAGATSWNLHIALSKAGATIQPSDMLMLFSGIDIAETSFIDNGTLAIDLTKGTAPEDNSTDGPVVKHGMETMGRPILYGDKDAPYNIWIGGYPEDDLSFSPSAGGYRAEVSKGTDYYPTAIVGFRNNQGIPSLTILFSNTRGVSKQATLEQQTVSYGNYSFVVWAVTEQHYGAAGVASTYGVNNYNGALTFPTTDGMMTMDTLPQVQNLISQRRISKEIGPYIRRIPTSSLSKVVGAAWDNKLYWIIPASGSTTPTEILIRDLDNNGAWYTWDIKADWIDVVSPDDESSFVYISVGEHTYMLKESSLTIDSLPDIVPFSMKMMGGLLGINAGHNAHMSVVQAVFYITNFAGEIWIGVNYRNENGRIKTKRKKVFGPSMAVNVGDGWSNVEHNYNGAPLPPGWDAQVQLYSLVISGVESTIREPLQMNVQATELQYFIETEPGYNSGKLEGVVYEGQNLGIKPDLR